MPTLYRILYSFKDWSGQTVTEVMYLTEDRYGFGENLYPKYAAAVEHQLVINTDLVMVYDRETNTKTLYHLQ